MSRSRFAAAAEFISSFPCESQDSAIKIRAIETWVSNCIMNISWKNHWKKRHEKVVCKKAAAGNRCIYVRMHMHVQFCAKRANAKSIDTRRVNP